MRTTICDGSDSCNCDMCKLHDRLPTDAQERKAIPLARGCFDYFPDALIAIAELSRIGNDQHNPGEDLHWDKDKSTDHADCLLRHMVDRGKIDDDKVRHTTKIAWRGLAMLQLEIEKERENGNTQDSKNSVN